MENKASELKSIRKWLVILSVLLAAILVILVSVFILPKIMEVSQVTQVQIRVECPYSIAYRYSTSEGVSEISSSASNFSQTLVRENLKTSWNVSMTVYLGTLYVGGQLVAPFHCTVIFQIPNGRIIKEETFQSPSTNVENPIGYTVTCAFP
jgi:hypothetical protein